MLLGSQLLGTALITSSVSNRNRTRDFYSAHESEVAETSLFTGAYLKQNRV